MEIVPYNGTTLAYIGDAVMSLKVREMLVLQGFQKPDVLQKKSILWVSAKAQAHFLDVLMKQNFFLEDEKAIILRGRNAKTQSVAKNASIIQYRLATGLEAVIGYFYLMNKKDRLEELWSAIIAIGEVL